MTPARRRSIPKALAFLLHRYVLGTERLTARASGFAVTVRADDVIGRHLYKYGVHDPALTGFLRRHVRPRPGDVLLDIGANVGWFSLVLASIAPEDVDIYAFEPHPDNRELLETNLRANGVDSVTVVDAAVSDAEGRRSLFVYEGENSGRHSLLPLHDGARVETPVVTLDRFWDRRDLEGRVPRFVKIDIEGHEAAAVEGGRAVLARCPTVVLEYSPALMRAGGTEPATLLDRMEGMGFEPTVLTEAGRHPASRDRLLSDDRQMNLVWERRPG